MKTESSKWPDLFLQLDIFKMVKDGTIMVDNTSMRFKEIQQSKFVAMDK